MGLLKKMSKKTEKESRNQPIATRLTESEHTAFVNLCEETGYSVAEALRLLVQQEIKGEDDEMFTKRIQTFTERKQFESESKQIEPTHTQLPPKTNTTVDNRKRIATATGRWTANEWKVNDELPCTICDAWVSASNFSRHLKKHGEITTQEFFTEHADKANEMVEQRKGTLL
ncbi:hypothetical protein [Bacillus sp. ISL-57]|uniref:hypothetical protein n=1 Tax=Bacillus sp. ISL-57 TaxID=2819135 RepID=UPI001BEA5507|nr:hypothetical protein [Bacillus sp. ISL-57]MBT2718313.1 hypothetical protein [Bacillus sp. ISL-57]